MRLVIGLAVLGLVTLALVVVMSVVPVMAQSVIPLPPPFGNAPSGCADWYIMKYLIEHHLWHRGMPPPILPMICWGPPLPPWFYNAELNALHECSAMGGHALSVGGNYLACLLPNGSVANIPLQ